MTTEPQTPPVNETGDASPAAETICTDTDALREELAAEKDRYVQLTDDFENFKRRSRQEAETRACAQKEAFMYELLPAIDNLERALLSGVSTGSLQFHQGVEMTLQQMRQLLRLHGVEHEESMGQPFDPHRHEAISQRHDPSQPEHTILEVFQRGYQRGGKILRPAKVVVNDRKHLRPSLHAH